LCARQQDDDLDHLGQHVIRIGQMGRQIGEELGQQNVMIDELDGEVDGASNRLAAAQKKMTHVLKKAGLRGQLSIIGILIVLLIILLLVAFS
jgi:t-SNARE complex subunit (syntaxin)